MNEEKNLVQSNAEKGRLLERVSAGLRCNMGDFQRGFGAESAKKIRSVRSIGERNLSRGARRRLKKVNGYRRYCAQDWKQSSSEQRRFFDRFA